MSLQELEERIDKKGAAKAIVVLSTAAYKDKYLPEPNRNGRVERKTPSFEKAQLSSLNELFTLGWSSLLQSRELDLDELELTIPEIRSLVIPGTDKETSTQVAFYPLLGILYCPINSTILRYLRDHDAVEALYLAPQNLELITPVSEEKVVPAKGAEIAWGIEKMGVAKLWDNNIKGKNVVIAHLDTGADSQQVLLKQAISSCIFISKTGFPTTPSIPFSDTGSHGTKTAGILVGRQVPAEPVIGMAPESTLACAVVAVGDIPERLISGIEWALASGARVLNISVGTPGWNNALDALMQIVRLQELLPVGAIGNKGTGTSTSPANSPSVLSVGAIDDKDQVPVFSSSQHSKNGPVGPLVCAPGVTTLTSAPGNQFSLVSGSSFAAPYVAGLAALLFSARPEATIDQVQLAILKSCQNLTYQPNSRIGAGVPFAPCALEELEKMLPG